MGGNNNNTTTATTTTQLVKQLEDVAAVSVDEGWPNDPCDNDVLVVQTAVICNKRSIPRSNNFKIRELRTTIGGSTSILRAFILIKS